MANVTSTTIDLGHVIVSDPVFRQDTLTFAGAATILPGTILARSTATAKLVPYVIGGATAGNGIPAFVMTESVTATGAGDKPVSVLIAGVVNKNRLVVNADGTAANITKAIEDQLRDFSIICQTLDQLSP